MAHYFTKFTTGWFRELLTTFYKLDRLALLLVINGSTEPMEWLRVQSSPNYQLPASYSFVILRTSVKMKEKWRRFLYCHFVYLGCGVRRPADPSRMPVRVAAAAR